MPTENIDSDELASLRQQAASAIPWSNEATRLAEALHIERPDHPLLRGEPWKGYFSAKIRRAVEPVVQAEADAISAIAEEAVRDGKQ